MTAVVTRERLHRIVALGLPIIGGMVSQNVLNLVDTAMVGSLGDAALAGVGIASFTNFMAQALIMGLGSGVQAMASRRLGQGSEATMAHPLNGGLMFAVLLGVPLAVGLFLLAPLAFPYLNSDPAVIQEGVPYLQARLVGAVAVGMNFAFRGYWNGVNLSRLYLRTLLFMHTVNIALNYVLIFGALGIEPMGATGAGIGTTIATCLGTGYYFLLGSRYARGAGFLAGIPDRATLQTMLRLAIPSGVQMLFFSGGMTALFWVIGKVGTAEVAAANVLINVMLVCILPAMGFGIAAGSLVGQALGAGDPDDAARWGWDVVIVGVVLLACLGAPMVAFPDVILSAFLSDPDTLALARGPLRLFGAFIAADAVGMVLQNALLGAGAARQVAAVSIGLQWLLLLPAVWVVGPVLGFGLFEIWVCQQAYRVLQAGVFATLWRRRGWAAIRV